MPVYKGVAYFEGPGCGWSETYYFDTGSSQQAVNLLTGAFAQARMALIAKSDTFPIVMVAARAQAVTNPLDTFLENINQPGTYAAPAGIDPEMPWVGILCRVIATDGSKRQLQLKGIPDDVAEGSWRLPPQRAKWSKAFFDFQDLCIRNAFRVQTIKETGHALKVISNIAAATGRLTVTTAVAHGLASGAFVTFRGVKAAVKVQGRYRVTVVDATSFSIGPFNVGTVGFISGFYRDLEYEYPQWETVQVVRKTRRSAGRPFFLLRGRR